jgi:peptidoglycan-associated lipoprotein
MSSSQTPSSNKSKFNRGPLFAAIFGAATLGGVLYFVLSARSAEPIAAAPAAKEPVAASQVAAEPAPVKAPPAPVMPSTEPTMYFATNESTLNADTKAALDAWAKRLSLDPKLTLTLEGHCDERGSKAYNQALGERRATATKDYLVAQGVDAARLTTISFGKSRPADAGHDEAAWSRNRRVEMRPMTALSQR